MEQSDNKIEHPRIGSHTLRFDTCFGFVVSLNGNHIELQHRRAHSGKSATIRESNHGSCVYKEHFAKYYVPKSSILLAGLVYGKLVCSMWVLLY